MPAESFMAALLVALPEDTDFGSPSSQLASEQLSRDIESYDSADAYEAIRESTLALQLWRRDPLARAFQRTDIPTTRLTQAISTPSAATEQFIVSGNKFLEELTATESSCMVKPPVVSLKESDSVDISPLLPMLSPKARGACQRHLREMHALRGILQRPDCAFYASVIYDALMEALQTDRGALVRFLLESTEKLRALSKTVRAEGLSLVLHLLDLYCEVLFFLSLRTRGRDGNADAFVLSVLQQDKGLRRRLLALIADLGGNLARDGFHGSLSPRRAAVLLACLSIEHIMWFEDSELDEVACRDDSRDNVFDLCVVASFPPLRKQSSTPTAVEPTPHVQLALDVMCHTQAYQLDIVSLFHEKGGAADAVSRETAAVLGRLLRRLLSTLTPQLCRCFSPAALLCLTKSLSMYAWTWNKSHDHLRGLLLYINDAVVDAMCADSCEPNLREPEDDEENPRAADVTGPHEPLDAAGETILSLVGRSVDTRAVSSVATDDLTKKDDRAGPLGSVYGDGSLDGGADSASRSRELATFESRTERLLFTLSLHAYVTASLAFFQESFASLRPFCVCALPPSMTSESAPVEAVDNGQDGAAKQENHYPGVSRARDNKTDKNCTQPADESAASRLQAKLFVVQPDTVQDRNGTVSLNLLHQAVCFLKVLSESEDFPRFLREGSSSALYRPYFIYFDAALQLLHRILCSFPHELSHASRAANQDLIVSMVTVVVSVLRAGPCDRPGTQRIVCDLAHRYASTFGNENTMSTLLLPRSLLSQVGRGRPSAVAIAFDQMTLLTHLTGGEVTGTVASGSLLLSLTSLEPGALSSTAEGTEYFVFFVNRLVSLLAIGALADSDLTGAVGHEYASAATAANVKGMLRDVDTPALCLCLVSRWCEGVAGLVRAVETGVLAIGGSSVQNCLARSLQILTEIVRLTDTAGVLASLPVPVPPTLANEEDRSRLIPMSYHLLRVVFCAEHVAFDVIRPAAELLCASTRACGTSLLPLLRSCLSKPLRRSLSASLHQTIKAEVGRRSNSVRLQTLWQLSQLDVQTIEHLVGPDSLPGNREAKELCDLIIAQVLSKVVLAGAESSLGEKAAALRLLVAFGLTDAVKLSRVSALLADTVSQLETDKKNNSGGCDACVLVTSTALVAAATQFINVCVLAQSQDSELADPHSGARGSGVALGSSSMANSGTSPKGPLSLAPQVNAAGGVIGGTGASVPAFSSEAVDVVIRQGCKVLLQSAHVYESFSAEMDFQSSSPGAAQADQSAVVSGILSGRVGHTAIASRGPGTMGGAVASHTSSADSYFSTINSASYREARWTRHGSERTAGSRALTSHSVYHTDALPDAVEESQEQTAVLFPLLLGTAYRFKPRAAQDRSFDDGYDEESAITSQNILASLLDSICSLCHEMECTLWLSGRSSSKGSIFLSRTAGILHAALRCSFLARAGAPSLVLSLCSCVQKTLSLAVAAASTMDAASQWSRETVDGVSELQLSPDVRRDLRYLTSFMCNCAGDLQLVNSCVRIFLGLSAASTEIGATDEVLRVIVATLQRRQADTDASAYGVTEKNDLLERQMLVDNCSMVLERHDISVITLDVLATLMQTLFREARSTSFSIVANAEEGPVSAHFASTLRCIRIAVLHARHPATAAAFLPTDDIFVMLEALGHFGCSVVEMGGGGQVCRRQAWHSAWCASLELMIAVVSGSNSDVMELPSERAWTEKLGTALEQLPRFLLALGAFTDIPEAERVYYVWDVVEMGLCTKLVALLCARGNTLLSLLPCVQRSFLTIRHFRLLRYCVATDSLRETATREAGEIEFILVAMARDQLTYCLIQSGQEASGTPAAAHTRVVAPSFHSGTPAGGKGWTAERPQLTFDVLRRFVGQELRTIRHSNVASDGAGDVTAPPTPSRESSLTRSPSRTYDAETLTEDETNTVGDEAAARQSADHRALHIDLAQLALGLFTTAAEAVVRQQDDHDVRKPSLSALFELRDTSESLLRLLESVRKDLGKMKSPKLTEMVALMRRRVAAVVKALPSRRSEQH